MLHHYRFLVSIGMCGAAVLPAAAYAAGTTARTIAVTGYYGASCGSTVSGNASFGTLNPAANPTNTSYSVAISAIVTCSTQTPFGIWSALSSKANGSQRRMYNSTANAYLNYTLYLNQGAGTIMPTSTTSSGFTSLSGNPTNVSGIAVVLPSGQTLQAGHYQDDIVITVSY